MKKRICQTAVIVAFFVVITLPLLTFRQPGRVSHIDNKNTATWPSLSDYSLLDARFTAAVDDVIFDNIGLKDEATVLNISAMYRLFGRIAISDYLLGSDDHVFWMPEHIMQSYQGLDQVTDTQLEELARRFTRLQDAVEAYGTQFVFMPIPNKDTVYRENMPDSVRVLSENNFLHGMKEYLLANTDVHVADTESALLSHKTDGRLLYWKNVDVSHWNSYGAVVGLEELMKTIDGLGLPVCYPTLDEADIVETETHDAIGFLSFYYKLLQRTFSDLSDMTYAVSFPPRWQSGQLDNSVPAGFSLADDDRDMYFHYHNDNAGSDCSVLIYGDSYIYSYLLPQLSLCFEDVYFLSANGCSVETVAELLSLLPDKPDCFVLETVSRQTGYQGLYNQSYALARAFTGFFDESHLLKLTEQPYAARELVFHIDTGGIDQTHIVHVPELAGDGILLLGGWAADMTENAATGGLFAQVGDEIVEAVPVQRPDLGQEIHDAGYQISIPLSALDGVSQMKLYALTPDGTAVYPPIELQVVH